LAAAARDDWKWIEGNDGEAEDEEEERRALWAWQERKKLGAGGRKARGRKRWDPSLGGRKREE